MRRPRQLSGAVIVRAYQPMSALSGLLATPDSGAAHENGTVIERPVGMFPLCQPDSSPVLRLSKANCQVPLRLSRPARWKSGRGCSGSGIGAGRADWAPNDVASSAAEAAARAIRMEGTALGMAKSAAAGSGAQP